jgi:KaiC/GvpD/RAD55 family RecA-like ATPase
MNFLVGGQDFRDLFDSKVGSGKCILFKYGPGSGGDVILKQYLTGTMEGTHSLYLSTHETENDLLSSVSDLDLPQDLEMISLVPDLTSELHDMVKKDRFRTDGIMVTDLLEVSSNTTSRKKRIGGGKKVLSVISSICMKQVLPFRLVIDSLVDLVRNTSIQEVEKRILLIKRAARDKQGTVILGAPLDWDEMRLIETTLFDAVISFRSDRTTGTWKRTMTLENLKGSISLPQEWEVTTLKSIPTAKSIK